MMHKIRLLNLSIVAFAYIIRLSAARFLAVLYSLVMRFGLFFRGFLVHNMLDSAVANE